MTKQSTEATAIYPSTIDEIQSLTYLMGTILDLEQRGIDLELLRNEICLALNSRCLPDHLAGRSSAQ